MNLDCFVKAQEYDYSGALQEMGSKKYNFMKKLILSFIMCLFAVGMAGDQDALDILSIVFVGQKLCKSACQPVKEGVSVLLDRSRVEIKEKVLGKNNVPAFAYTDLRPVAERGDDAVLNLFKDAETHVRDRLDVGTQARQFVRRQRDIRVLISNHFFLIGDERVGRGYLIFLCLNIDTGGFQVEGERGKLVLCVLYLNQRGGKGIFRLLETVLRADQPVAGDHVLQVGDQHKKEQNQRNAGHHVRVGRPESLFPFAGIDDTVGFKGTLPLH